MSQLTFILSAMLFGYVACSITIDPVDPILRLDETAKIMCKAPSSIENCFWYINNALLNPSTAGTGRIRSFGSLEDGECGIEFMTITEAENAAVTCHVFLVGQSDKAESATANVTTLVLPTIVMDGVVNNKVNAVAGEEAELKCTVAGARPTPAVLWKIGDREIDESFRTTSVSMDDNLATIVDTLRYSFAPSDHGQQVRCVTAGSWIVVGQDEYDAYAQLDVMFAPQPQEPMKLYGFVDGQPGDIFVNFTANPQPTKVSWLLDTNERLDVPATGVNYDNPDFEVHPMTGSQGPYEARLRLKTVTEESAARVYRLSVESFLKGEEQIQEYTVHISMNAAPLPSAELGGGEIAAIILVMIALLVLVAVLLYARNTGRWCFAGTKAVGVSTKERADEEAANVELDEADDVKVEANPRQSLTNRLSSLYETILSKAAPNKKSERFTGVGNTAADVDVKDGAIVYAELDLKSSDESSCLRGKEETTEYAEIVPINTDDAPVTKTSDDTGDDQTTA